MDESSGIAEDPRSRSFGRIEYHHGFVSKYCEHPRTIAVYVPPGYDSRPQQTCAVLYLHDGQNLFEPHHAAFGVSWQAHTTADRLIREGRIPPIVLVGIANTPARHQEYTWHHDARRLEGGKGKEYGLMLREEIKPFVDAHYRTSQAREKTGIAGSSLGGLISLALAREHVDIFGFAGLLSPSLWWSQEELLNEMAGRQPWMQSVRFWLDSGTRESSSRRAVPPEIVRTRRLAAAFDRNQLIPGRDYYYTEIAAGEHNEAAWAARFDRVLLFFFGILF